MPTSQEQIGGGWARAGAEKHRRGTEAIPAGATEVAVTFNPEFDGPPSHFLAWVESPDMDGANLGATPETAAKDGATVTLHGPAPAGHLLKWIAIQ